MREEKVFKFSKRQVTVIVMVIAIAALCLTGVLFQAMSGGIEAFSERATEMLIPQSEKQAPPPNTAPRVPGL